MYFFPVHYYHIIASPKWNAINLLSTTDIALKKRREILKRNFGLRFNSNISFLPCLISLLDGFIMTMDAEGMIGVRRSVSLIQKYPVACYIDVVH